MQRQAQRTTRAVSLWAWLRGSLLLLTALVLILAPEIAASRTAGASPSSTASPAAQARVTARIVNPVVVRDGRIERRDQRVLIERSRPCAPHATPAPTTPANDETPPDTLCRVTIVDLQ